MTRCPGTAAHVYNPTEVAVASDGTVYFSDQYNSQVKKLSPQGQLVTPGLIDLHTHCYWGTTYWGIEADPVAARSGVTTWLEAVGRSALA